MNMEINREEPEVQFYLAYYMENGEVDENGEMDIKMKTAVVPIRLKEKFLETFKDNPTPSKKEIFKFLDSHE
jgi:hypothetical protein